MRLTSEIIRDQINEGWVRHANYMAEGKYLQALNEEFAQDVKEKAYDKALKREKKEARKGWWGR